MLLSAGPRPRVAVVLNQNARGMRPEILERLGRLVPERDLYVSSSLEESRAIAGQVMSRSYEHVLFGGGDGTFVRCLADISNEAELRDMPLPRVGVLRLGSGNALADALGASAPTANGLVRDLMRARTQQTGKTLPLLEVDGNLTPFAGCGLDAQILDDFHATSVLVDRLGGKHAKRLGAGARYALTVGLRSVPRFLTTANPEVEVINTGSDAYRIDWKTGRVMDEAPIAAGEVLFRGPAALCSTATIPYFGLKMKMFPYVHLMPRRFQLRCTTAGAYEILRNLPAVFTGEYRAPSLHDFLADAIEIRMAKPVPVQIGGDLQDGLRDRLSIRLGERPIRVIS